MASSLIQQDLVSAETYNSLPHIREASRFPTEDKEALDSLRALLTKHNLPPSISVRLIHKHFDARAGEVMLLEKLDVPDEGSVKVMRPILVAAVADAPQQLHGLHYLVNSDGQLQAFEYGTSSMGAVPDLSPFGAFITDFCGLVRERGLQHKFGLKLRTTDGDDDDDDTVDAQRRSSWTEYEFPARRSTITIPEGMPVPKGDFDIRVSTDWSGGPARRGDEWCLHYCEHCEHCGHCYDHGEDDHLPGGEAGGGQAFCLAGQAILPGTPVYRIVAAVNEICVC